MQALLQPFRQFAGPDLALTSDEVARAKGAAAAQARAYQMMQFFLLDLDGDGRLTKAELTTSGMRPWIPQVVNFQSMDTDGDGAVTMQEALQAAKKAKPRYFGISNDTGDSLAALLALDPNRDGKLTYAELEKLGLDAFAFFDRNGDATLTDDESRTIQKARSAYQQRKSYERSMASCDLPQADAGDELIMVTAYETGTLSDVAVGSRNLETQTSELRIEAGDKPLYIVASSYESVIWRVTGHVERVAKFVAASTMPNVGVAGLPHNRVALRPAGRCLGWVSDSPPSNIRDRASALAGVVGTTSVKVLAAYQLNAATLPSNAVEADRWVPLKGRPNLLGLPMSDYGLSGIDEEAFSALSRSKPGGVVHVDPKTVVSNVEAEAYDVLPEWAGLLQLIRQGAVKREKLDIIVTKPIPRFPARLGARYVLEGDIPVPDAGDRNLIISRMGPDGVKTRLELRKLPFAAKPGGVE